MTRVSVPAQSPVLVAQDLSAVSAISMGVAVPLLTAFGQQLAILPTSLLSTQTEGFGQPASADLTTWLPATFAHWQAQQIQTHGVLTGYLGRNQIVDQLTEFIQRQTEQLVVIDPVMGDQGALYPDLPADYPDHMRQLIHAATVIVPNLTEAEFLTGHQVTATDTLQSLLPILDALQAQLQPDGHAIITGITLADQQGCVWLDDHHHVQFIGRPILAGHFFGSGDVFAALLTGFLLHHEPLDRAIALATRGTFWALLDTNNAPRERRYGIVLSSVMAAIANYQQVGQFTPRLN